MKNVMLDCESFGLKLNSAILTIGAVEFDPYSKRIGVAAHLAIDLDDSLRHGLSVDSGAIQWWLTQSRSAQEALAKKLGDSLKLAEALHRLTDFLRMCAPKEHIKVWSCGMMDFAWLESAYSAIGQPVPWNYRIGDYRTIRDEFSTPYDAPSEMKNHGALGDAIWQAQHLQNIYARLGKTA